MVRLGIRSIKVLARVCLAPIKVTTMTLIKDKGSDSFAPCPAGNHAARVCEVVFLGTVHTSFKNVEKDTPQIKIAFEVPSERREDGTPFIVGTMPLTASTNKKASFRKLVLGIIGTEPGKEFESDQLIGKECLINVIHNASKSDPNVIYANITGASPLPKGMTVGPAVAEPLNFDVNTSPLSDIEKLPEFIQKLICSTPEYAARLAAEGGLPKTF